jgi:hypothetical protein
LRDGTLKRSTFRQYMGIVRSMVREQLQAGTACGCAKTAGSCRELLAVEPALWTFVRVEGIEPTNNVAERPLQHAVLWRKASHGTDSEIGSRFVENILTVVATCRQQGRNVLECLTGCCRAALEGTPRVSPTGAPRRRLTGWGRSRIGASIEDGGKADGHRGSASGQVCSAQATLEGAYPTPLAKDEKLT